MFATGIGIRLNFLADQIWEATGAEATDEVAWSSRMIDALLVAWPTNAELAAAAGVISGSRAGGRA